MGGALASVGLQPVIFEQADAPGGQWHQENPGSGIWSGMETNTSRELTHFSGFYWQCPVPAFPLAERVFEYLQDYLDVCGIADAVRLNHRVDFIGRADEGGWELRVTNAGGEQKRHLFAKVIVATGRFTRPFLPPIDGLDGDVPDPYGRADILHSSAYEGAKSCAGRRVLVAGGAISALDIAADIARGGAAAVTVSSRRQRYVLRKLYKGIPTDHFNYCLSEALAAERLDPDEVASETKAFILESAGSPDRYGTPKPADDVRQAAVTKSEHFLDEVASGRIALKPWIESIRGQQATFADGSTDQFDRIILATGFTPDLPFLDQEICDTLHLNGELMDLYRYTFHPDLPGLAFHGLYDLAGPNFPPIELQARWIAQCFANPESMPVDSVMREGIEVYRQSRHLPQKKPMHIVTVMFARELGVLPDPGNWPNIARYILFGPLCPSLFRLEGPGARQEAPDEIRKAALAFNMLDTPDFTQSELERLRQVGI